MCAISYVGVKYRLNRVFVGLRVTPRDFRECGRTKESRGIPGRDVASTCVLRPHVGVGGVPGFPEYNSVNVPGFTRSVRESSTSIVNIQTREYRENTGGLYTGSKSE